MAQTDTMIVYDVSTKTVSLIPPVAFDKTTTFEQTPSYIGNLGNKVMFSLTPPTSNLFSGAAFSKLARAELFYNLTDYPVRTAVSFQGYKNGKLGPECSGIMVGENMVLTAAHCIWYAFVKPTEWNFDSILVVPAFNNGKPQGGLQSSVATKYYLFKSFYSEGDYDVALLQLKHPIGRQTGWVGIGFNKDTNFYANAVFHKLSYPGVPDPSDPSKIYNGDTLYYNYGKIINLGNGLGIPGPEAEGIPGQSGSSFLYTDNSAYYSVGVASLTYACYHDKITQVAYYQLKNIITNSSTRVTENDFDSMYIHVYPNPATSSLTVKTDTGEKYKLSVTTIHGQQVYARDSGFLNDCIIDVSNFSNGIYFLTVQNDRHFFVKKVMIQR